MFNSKKKKRHKSHITHRKSITVIPCSLFELHLNAACISAPGPAPLPPGQVRKPSTHTHTHALTQVGSRQVQSGPECLSSRRVTAAAAMAESQLMCMEDGRIGTNIPESKPEFYYSEPQRAAIEELLKNGDSAFKMRLKEDDTKDFLSAREVKLLVTTFRKYESCEDSSTDTGTSTGKASPSKSEKGAAGTDADSGVHSTYWPQMSDTEVPPLDIGWPSGAMFKGVTRVAVHTHPPKDNGPHIKEVVRRLIQEANKVRRTGGQNH